MAPQGGLKWKKLLINKIFREGDKIAPMKKVMLGKS
jgi:hypothetical protein